MNEIVKIDLKISRKNVLLLHHVMQRGLTENDGTSSVLLQSAARENILELQQLSQECLERAGLTLLHEKLTDLGENKKQ
ncbi:hypothetical protein D3C85_1671600 [compost metagenome]